MPDWCPWKTPRMYISPLFAKQLAVWTRHTVLPSLNVVPVEFAPRWTPTADSSAWQYIPDAVAWMVEVRGVLFSASTKPRRVGMSTLPTAPGLTPVMVRAPRTMLSSSPAVESMATLLPLFAMSSGTWALPTKTDAGVSYVSYVSGAKVAVSVTVTVTVA